MTRPERESPHSSTRWQTYSPDPHQSHHTRVDLTLWGQDGTNGVLGTLKKLDARVSIVEQTIATSKWLALLIMVGLTLSEKKTISEVIIHVLKLVASAS